MPALYFLIPVAVLIVGFVIALLIWAINSGQYDDLDGPAHTILFEDLTSNQKSSNNKIIKPYKKEEDKIRG